MFSNYFNELNVTIVYIKKVFQKVKIKRIYFAYSLFTRMGFCYEISNIKISHNLKFQITQNLEREIHTSLTKIHLFRNYVFYDIGRFVKNGSFVLIFNKKKQFSVSFLRFYSEYLIIVCVISEI